jgi:arylsulfate sulfotransferase
MSFVSRLFLLIKPLSIAGILLNFNITLAQNTDVEKFQYISPLPSSKLNSTETNIIIRFGKAYEESQLKEGSPLRVIGSKSGQHNGNIILAENNNTLIFRPYKQFADGEIVTVELDENIKTVTGEQIPRLSYSFETSRVNLNKNIKSDPQKYLKFLSLDFDINADRPIQKINLKQNKFLPKSYTIQPDFLPEDFPMYVVDSINNPSPGCIFFSPFMGSFSTYIIIADKYGIPIFYRKMNDGRTFDFKKQTTNVLTYYDEGPNLQYVLDSSYNIIDTLYMQNGYITDLHELVILENNHALMMSYDVQQVAMDTIVKGGNPSAAVIGLVIQELDQNKNVVFQWRSWDHFQITDATYNIDLTDSLIDYVHGNAIEMDNDGNILISSRHLDEITKINRGTGEIMWRWGGEYCKNNEFTFTNDLIGFSHQHDIRRLPNGNLTLFDNGNLLHFQEPFSRAVEYQLDEVNKTATLVWEYKNNPDTYNQAMGNVQRLNNLHTIIGWGIDYTNKSPAISEVIGNGEVAFYLTLPDDDWSYRVFKFPWKTNLFVTNPDSLFFGRVSIGDSITKSLVINNNSNHEIEINGVLNRDSAYSLNSSLHLVIQAFDNITVQVTFKPKTEGNHNDDLHLQWNTSNERIAQVVPMLGETDSAATDIEEERNKFDYFLNQNYPNPFNPSTKISFSTPERGRVLLGVYDTLGRKIKTLISKVMTSGNHEVSFDASNLPSGVYFYSLEVNDYKNTKKMILLH